MMRAAPYIILAALLGSSSLSAPVQAQLKVYDSKNHIENILSALRALIQINNQLVMLTKQQGSIDRAYAQSTVYQAIGSLEFLADTLRYLGDQNMYSGLYGPSLRDFSEADLSKSWDNPRRLAHMTANHSFGLLERQLPTVLRQAEQIRQNLALARSQDGIVGAVQATTEMLGSLGDHLSSLQLVASQTLRAQTVEDARLLQERERDLEAHRRFGLSIPKAKPTVDFWGTK